MSNLIRVAGHVRYWLFRYRHILLLLWLMFTVTVFVIVLLGIVAVFVVIDAIVMIRRWHKCVL